jgi:hypothetical protein
MKKNILLLIYFVCQASFSFSQTLEDVIYLKNGSVIHGIILEQIPDQTIKIKSDKNVFLFKMSEVAKIVKEEVLVQQSPSQTTSNSILTQTSESIKSFIENKISKESNGLIKMIDFEKTDGASRTVNGQNWYDMYFTITILPIQEIYKPGHEILGFNELWKTFQLAPFRPKKGSWDENLSYASGGVKTYAGNVPIRLTGYTSSFKTEKNWYINVLKFEKEVILSDNVTQNKINTYDQNKSELSEDDFRKKTENLKLQYTAIDVPNSESEYGEISFKNSCSDCNGDFTFEILNKIHEILNNSPRIKITNEDLSNKFQQCHFVELTLNSLNLSSSKTPTGEFSSATISTSISWKVFDKSRNEISNTPLDIKEISFSANHADKLELIKWFLVRLEDRFKKLRVSFIDIKGSINSTGELSKNGEVKSVFVKNNHILDESLKYSIEVFNYKTEKIAIGTLKKFKGEEIEFNLSKGGDLFQKAFNEDKQLKVLIFVR